MSVVRTDCPKHQDTMLACRESLALSASQAPSTAATATSCPPLFRGGYLGHQSVVSVSQGSPELLLNQALPTGASIDFEQTSPTYNYNKARSYWNWIRLWNYAQPPDVILEAGGSIGVQGGVGSDRSSLGLGTGNNAGKPRG